VLYVFFFALSSVYYLKKNRIAVGKVVGGKSAAVLVALPLSI